MRRFALPMLNRSPVGAGALRLGAACSLLVLSAVFALIVNSWSAPFPDELTHPPQFGQRILDRDGQLLARTTAKDGVFRAPLSIGHVGPHLVGAMLAAEDKRFFSHAGIDAWAIARAGLQALTHGRLVSGASTITQQLARTTFERPRSALGKWQEMAVALTLERKLTKEQILGLYLNRVSFGPRIVGAAAAADHYFGKDLPALSLAEAATLAGLVRGPTLYDPRVRGRLAQERRDRVLGRMVEAGFTTKREAALARAAGVHLLPRPPVSGAEHWVRQVARRSEIRLAQTTLVGPLQRQVEALVWEHATRIEGKWVSAASVIVLDNATGEILSWVGSPDFEKSREGQNDGVTARRQPGSTLKPFLYAMGIEELGLTTASFLPDEPTQFRSGDGFYEPRNFDRTYRGRVRLARALSNSLNVPAVQLISLLGIDHALERLRALGLTSLDRSAAHYGPALALGDGEVTLLDLTAAYAALARGGTTVTPRFLLDAPPAPGKRVLSPEACALVTEVLSDGAARRETFGGTNALELPFAVAAKTGTSKGYRDSWTVGYTRAITVGVWVGNFDGSPTARMTGARGAGPLFHQVMEAGAQVLGPRVNQPGTHRPLHDVPLRRAAVCGEREQPTGEAACAPGERSVLLWFGPGQPEGSSLGADAPSRQDAAHPQELSLHREAAPREALRIAFPADGMVFTYDPAIPAERQRLILRATPTAQAVALLVNETPLVTRAGRAEWPVRRGRYEVVATAPGNQRSEPVEFFVR